MQEKCHGNEKKLNLIYFYIFLFQAGIPDPPNMSEDLIKIKAKERYFLEQLLDGKKLENYKIPVPIKAELRKYQQVCSYRKFLFHSISIISSPHLRLCFLSGYWLIYLII